MTQSSTDILFIGAIVVFAALIAFMGYRFFNERKTSDNKQNYYRTELESLRARIANMDKSGNIENYRSANNPTITIVGTLLEKIIDIIMTFLDGPASRELTESIINNPNDATHIAEYIEQIADAVIATMKGGDALTCASRNSTDNCTNYQLNSQMVTNIANKIRQELRNIVNSTSEQDKLYTAAVNMSYRQAQFMPHHVAYDDIPEKDDFVARLQNVINGI